MCAQKKLDYKTADLDTSRPIGVGGYQRDARQRRDLSVEQFHLLKGRFAKKRFAAGMLPW